MTEKRFEITEYGSEYYIEIIDNNKELDENIDNPTQRLDLVECCELLNKQEATIKSKDKQLERLYNYFQDYLKDEMSGNAFSEMWDFVKEDEKWEDE